MNDYRKISLVKLFAQSLFLTKNHDYLHQSLCIIDEGREVVEDLFVFQVLQGPLLSGVMLLPNGYLQFQNLMLNVGNIIL